MESTKIDTTVLKEKLKVFEFSVGVPLMALTLDGGRIRGAEAKLSNATEAACDAYANALDVDDWERGVRQFAPNAENTALDVFYRSAPSGSDLTTAPTVTDGKPLEVYCTGHTEIVPIINLGLGDYSTYVQAYAKADWTGCGFEFTSNFSGKPCSNAP